jgi:hypothetical protein
LKLYVSADAVTKDGFTKAYLALGGEGWTLRAFIWRRTCEPSRRR